jgi:hypothetical protein
MLFRKEAYMVPNPKNNFHFVPNFHMVFVFVKFAETLRRHVGGFHSSIRDKLWFF